MTWLRGDGFVCLRQRSQDAHIRRRPYQTKAPKQTTHITRVLETLHFVSAESKDFESQLVVAMSGVA